MALINSQTVSVQLEFVRPVVPTLFERTGTTFSMIEKRPADMVSSRTARIPLAASAGGNAHAADFDGPSLGRGSADEYAHGTVTPVGMAFGVEITKLTEYATNSSQKAVLNVTKKAAVNGLKQFRADIDGWLQTAGNGQIGTIQSGQTTTTWTLTNTPFGARLMRKNLRLSVYDTTLATKRGEVLINSNPVRGLGKAQVITVENVDGGTAVANSVNGDKLLVAGLTGASPTWLNGIPYHHNTSTSGTWQGIARTNDYVVANGVDANAGAFSLPPFRLAINKIMQELGDDAVASGMFWHTHPAALAGYEEYGLTLSRLDRGGDNEEMKAGLFNSKSMKIGGFPVKTNIHADPTRFDLMNLQTWGRVEWKPIDMYEIGGDTVFPTYGSDGGVGTAYLFYYVAGFQFFTDNPKAISSVTNVGLPTGYSA